MPTPLEVILQSRLVAIIRLNDLANAVALSRALLDAGIVAQEFTLTNPQALDAVRQVLKDIKQFSNGEASLGVGSVRTTQQAAEAIRSGAQFLVSPIHDLPIVNYCVEHQIPILSGAYTPSEIASAWNAGASIVKVFPARGLGPNFIKDVLAPMPELQLMPTGGVDLENIPLYFAAGAVAVGVGGNLLDAQAIARNDWSQVTQTAAAYACIARTVT
jgi:2-dehydro-3-deoxyphosphogluconate aldolase / (4S)-4-hydroxy-2-oxoglutarate aldolase